MILLRIAFGQTVLYFPQITNLWLSSSKDFFKIKMLTTFGMLLKQYE
jgi:hypothetical protein